MTPPNPFPRALPALVLASAFIGLLMCGIVAVAALGAVAR